MNAFGPKKFKYRVWCQNGKITKKDLRLLDGDLSQEIIHFGQLIVGVALGDGGQSGGNVGHDVQREFSALKQKGFVMESRDRKSFTDQDSILRQKVTKLSR